MESSYVIAHPTIKTLSSLLVKVMRNCRAALFVLVTAPPSIKTVEYSFLDVHQ
jgi:hypothetical protein